MALLTVEKRKEYFKALDLGEYNDGNIKALQKRYMLRKRDADGVYGNDTDNLLRHLWNCHLYLKPENFKPEEFRCGCNGRHCCGYPTFMKEAELKNVQAIRTHFGKPMVITCGLRCPEYNREVGGISNSEHKKGLAVDYYIKGVTDTLANRKSNIAWISKLPGHHYTYGDGIFIETANGKTSRGYVSAPGMGNALHTDSRAGESAYDEDGKLICDGSGGPATVKETQRFFGTTQDGVISGQNKRLAKFYPALTAVTYGDGGSPCIKNLQRWVGTTQDGILGENTIKALQEKLKSEGYYKGAIDAVFGTNSMKAWQKYLNENEKAVYPKPREFFEVIDVSDWQGKIDWQKVKADGIVGAVIRYADGTTLDNRFTENMKGAKAAGLHVGAYIYSRAKTKAEAESEAERLYNACKPYNLDMPLYIDVEARGLEGYADTVAPAFLNKMAKLGGKGGVYSYLVWWNNYLKKTAADYSASPFWIAQYNETMDYKPASKMGMWQYTSEGRVDGIKGNVCKDKCFVAYWEEKPKPAPAPEKKTVNQLAQEVLDGKWGTGDERKRQLEEEGYDYYAVQKRVDEIVKILDDIMEACAAQADWMRHSEYEWEPDPTIPKSRKKGTCVTYEGCVYQRLGVLKSGGYLWHTGKGYGTGKVTHANALMNVKYLGNKTLTSLKGELRKGDCIMLDDNKSGEPGNGGHVLFLTGRWTASGKPYVWDNHSAQQGLGAYIYNGSRKVLARIRLLSTM